MLLLWFEVTPREGPVDEYLSLAADRPDEHPHIHAFDAVRSAPTLAALPRAARLRVGEIERDHGVHDRAEAPQYYAPVTHRPRPGS